jgi:diguanylate cyclase (GGDEF)-like protein
METRVHSNPLGVWEELRDAEGLLNRADPQTRLWFLLRRAQAHNALYMYDEFEHDVATARDMKKVVDAPESLCLWFDVYAGLIAVRGGELQRGIDLLQQAAQRALDSDANRVYVFAVQELAFTRGILEQYDASLQDLHKAYAVALRLNQPDLIAVVNDAYGAVYAYMADYARSIDYYLLALSEFEELGYKEQAASVIQGLASTFRYSGQWEQAERYFRQYLEFTDYAPGKRRLFYGNYGLAMTFADQGDCTRALPQIQRTLPMAGPADYKAELYKRQALCEARKGRLTEAQVALQKAADILNAIPELEGTTWVLELDQIEASIEYFRGNTEKAFELLDGYHENYIQQMEKSSSNRMDMLRAQLEHDRKDLEIALLERQAEVNQLEMDVHLQANQTQRYVIALALFVSVAVLAGLMVLRRTNRRILALSHRDALSGLYNRRYTFDYLEKVIPGISVDDGGLSIILLDIDDFKDINDSYGHPVGDEVIKRIASVGESSLRNRDIMGRIGGEEFLCVLPRTTYAQSMHVAQRLLEAISAEEFEAGDGRTFTTSISIGIANFDTSVTNADQLYSRADEAMYQSKAAGKGRITAYQAY